MKRRILIAAVSGPLLVTGSFDILARDSRKEPITEKHYSSKTFFNLQRITRLGALDVQVLYAISGAKDFKEFAVATVAARFLKVDRGLVLAALHERTGPRRRMVEKAVATFPMPARSSLEQLLELLEVLGNLG